MFQLTQQSSRPIDTTEIKTSKPVLQMNKLNDEGIEERQIFSKEVSSKGKEIVLKSSLGEGATIQIRWRRIAILHLNNKTIK